MIGHCFIALLCILFSNTTLKCVGYVYISIYKRVATFSGTPGGSAPTKNRARQHMHPAPRAPAHRPRAPARSFWDMDKTEASVIRIQISRTDPANQHSFVGQMSHNKSWTTFRVNLSAQYGLTLIYHKMNHLSSALPLQLDDNEPDQRSPGKGTVKAFYLTPKDD